MNSLPNARIRLIREHETKAVSELTVEAYAAAYRLHNAYRDELGRVAERVETQQVWVAVDREDGALLGTVTTPLPGRRLSDFAGAEDLDFRMLAVFPRGRGRGIGRALVAHCAGLARDRGASRLVLHTGDDMRPAIALYERMGFERLTEIERDFPFPPGVRYPVRVYGMTV